MSERREPLTLEDYKAIGEAAEWLAQQHLHEYERQIIKQSAFRKATFKVLAQILSLIDKHLEEMADAVSDR